MVRELVKELQPDDINYYEWAGLSTDSKPTYGCTGSLFIEVDNGGKAYMFDEVEPKWYPVGGSSSENSGGGSGE